MTKLRLAFYLFITFLTACTSAPAKIEYYSLSFDLEAASSKSTTLEDDEKKLVLVEQIVLADFLRQQGLVVQTSKNKIHISSQHRWAESLDEAISRTIIGHLENNLPQYRFENHQSRWDKRPEFRLNLAFSHFHTNALNQVVVAGNYWILNGDNQLLTKQRFNFTKSLTKDGYLNSVEELNSAIKSLAEKIESEIN